MDKDFGINEADRVNYEHVHLCDMLQMAMMYDQLDVSGLGCFELLVRRRQVLEEASGANPKAFFATTPSRTSWGRASRTLRLR